MTQLQVNPVFEIHIEIRIAGDNVSMQGRRDNTPVSRA